MRDQYLVAKALSVEMYDESIDLAELPESFERRLLGRHEMGRRLAVAYGNGAFGAIDSVAKAELASVCRRRMLSVAIEIQLYKEQQGHYPSSLDEIVGEVGESAVLDPISESRFVYQVDGDGGYALYSIGFNEVDDGGRNNTTEAPEADDLSVIVPEPLTWEQYVEELGELYTN